MFVEACVKLKKWLYDSNDDRIIPWHILFMTQNTLNFWYINVSIFSFSYFKFHCTYIFSEIVSFFVYINWKQVNINEDFEIKSK